MDWLKKNYDLALLGLSTFLVAVSVALIFVSASAPPVGAEIQIPPRSPAPAASLDMDSIKSARDALDAPPRRIMAHSGSPFVSRSYLLIVENGEQKIIDPVEGTEDLHPPLTNAWIIRNRLDYSDKGIKERDPDGDGFTNLEEYEADTDPNKPSSMPPSFTKLRLVEFTPVPFRIEFKGDPTGLGKEFQINFRDLAGKARTQYKKIGDTLDAGPDRPPYIIREYAKKSEPNARGILTDVSELTIENSLTGEKIILVYNVEQNDPSSEAIFRNELDGTQVKLRKHEEFTVAPDEKSKFKVVDISESSAKIKDLATGVELTIKKSESAVPSSQ